MIFTMQSYKKLPCKTNIQPLNSVKHFGRLLRAAAQQPDPAQ